MGLLDRIEIKVSPAKERITVEGTILTWHIRVQARLKINQYVILAKTYSVPATITLLQFKTLIVNDVQAAAEQAQNYETLYMNFIRQVTAQLES